MTATVLTAFRSLLLVLLFACVAFMASCVAGETSGDSADPLANSDFLAAVEEVQEAGVTPYWLGTDFVVEGVPFEITSDAKTLSPLHHSPGLGLYYLGALSEGTVPLYLKSFSEDSGEAEFYREQAATLPSTAAQEVQVGAWPGELYERSSGPRPVNQLWLLVDIGEVTVIAQAAAVVNGIPGEDPNPLIDKDLLISVMAEHLRPYPE